MRKSVLVVLALAAFCSPRQIVAQIVSPAAVASRIQNAPEIDGVLDEAFWQTIPVISDFVQREPVDGALPSERTEVRIAYDEGHLYFGFVLYDSQPELIRRSILHREGRIDQDDHIWIGLDTYNDDRNGYIFELNSFGTQGDALFNDESMTLDDWNWEGVYESEARITSEGWTLEVAIPFTTIRFSDVEAPEMGIAIRRAIRRKNEEVYWPHIPQEYRSGFMTVSQYATLSGLEDLRRGRYMEVKPFGIAGIQKRAGEESDVLDDLGVDFKYALTSNLALDLTYNTDFAQVEADNVQINLTRFSLFFPEKREFFLERAGLFSFGKARDTEVFFSRRVGRTNDIIGGGRLTGQVGPLSIGVLSLQTDDLSDGPNVVTPGANNSVLRLRADVMPRTTLGGIFTSLQNGDGHNRVVGVDTQVRFWNSSSLDAWWANARDSDAGNSNAGAVELKLQPERWYSVTGNLQSVDENFD
ncbi:MAG: carbohydrate binding family 9 domain-containing protein, partial [Longimicrobiales bacterium]|nr:carbohydrate binding family 9 domain-containing protein [Longimicrobiales bacterium]